MPVPFGGQYYCCNHFNQTLCKVAHKMSAHLFQSHLVQTLWLFSSGKTPAYFSWVRISSSITFCFCFSFQVDDKDCNIEKKSKHKAEKKSVFLMDNQNVIYSFELLLRRFRSEKSGTRILFTEITVHLYHT